jgi:hypothetical protein
VYGFDVSGRTKKASHEHATGREESSRRRKTHAAGVIAGIIAEVGDGRKRSASAHARKQKDRDAAGVVD